MSTENGSPAQVFISYSRKDAEAAERLRLNLLAQGFEAYLDTHDIAAGEEWRGRLGGLIESADTMVFLISPDSIASRICDWEVNHAELLGKRIIPVVWRDPEGADVPERLRRLNYVFMRGEAEEKTGLPKLTEALKVDIAWVRAHTRYGELAADWDRARRPSRLLLRSASIGEAEQWRDSRPPTAPQLTETQSAFIAQSRRAATARARGWLAAALGIAALAIGLSIYAFLQQQAAEASRKETATVLATSDFRQGSALADSPDTAADGVAYLSRAARAGDSRAETRLWTLLQQRSFWVPAGEAPAAAPPDAPLQVPPEIAARFATVEIDGAEAPTESIAISPDGCCVFVSTGSVVYGTDVRVRVFTAAGAPLTDWIQPRYTGDTYLYTATGTLSDQGRYLAVEAQGWREPSYLVVYDLWGEAGPAEIDANITASGPLPATQNAPFSVVRFHHRAGRTDDDEPPILLVGSARGDAAAYSYYEGEYYELARASHRSPVTLVETDAEQTWLMTATEDRTVRVNGLGHGEILGSPIRLDDTVTTLARTGPAELSVGYAATSSRFAFREPVKLAYAGTLGATEGAGGLQEACYRTGGLTASEGPVAHPSGLTLALANDRQAEITVNGSPHLSPRFVTRIATLCANAAGDAVSITTEDFHTEIWSADFSRRLGPVIDESRFFDAWPTPSVTDWVQISPDGRIALIRSSFWNPPNLEFLWLTAWDIETGLPLSEHEMFDDDSLTEGVISSATYNPATNAIVYLSYGKPTGTALALSPPQPARASLPAYMEAMAGQLIDPQGLSEPVPDRVERLTAGAPLLTPEQNGD